MGLVSSWCDAWATFCSKSLMLRKEPIVVVVNGWVVDGVASQGGDGSDGVGDGAAKR